MKKLIAALCLVASPVAAGAQPLTLPQCEAVLKRECDQCLHGAVDSAKGVLALAMPASHAVACTDWKAVAAFDAIVWAGFGCGLACAVLGLGGVLSYSLRPGDNPIGAFILCVVAAVLVWLVGRACRYVLSGN